MFIQDKKNKSKESEEKGKVLEDFFKGKSFTLKVVIDFQELNLHETVVMSSLYLWYYDVKDYACLKRTRKSMKEEFKFVHFEKIGTWVPRLRVSNFLSNLMNKLWS